MKQLARQYVYWKNIDKDIEKLVKSCEDCMHIKKNPTKAPIHHWEEPSQNFQRVHIDYAGPFQDHFFFILVDAKSRWLEVRYSKTAPTSHSTISLLNDIFAAHGLPEVMVSDNATIFTSETFVNFCTDLGIQQKFIAPGHPATNGIAERNVQTFKQKLKAMVASALPLQRKVQEILMRYRTTPLSCGKSPSDLYLGRRMRTKLDLLKPPLPSSPSKGITPGTRQLSVGDYVQARWYTSSKPTWKLGSVIKKMGKLHYLIKLDDGHCLKRHIDQLLLRSQPKVQPKKSVTFAPPDFIIDCEPSSSDSELRSAPPERTESNDQPPNEPQPNEASRAETESPETLELRRSGRQRNLPVRLQDYDLS